MYTSQTIVIIGDGAVSRGIVSGLSNGHDRVIFCEGNHEAAQQFTGSLQATHPKYEVEAVQCSFEATWEADVIILTLPCTDREKIANKIRDVATQKIVVTVNTSMKELHDLLPNSKIVQAFTDINVEAFNLPFDEKKQISCIVRGTDKEALKTVAELVKTIGFTPIIMQSIDESKSVESVPYNSLT